MTTHVNHRRTGTREGAVPEALATVTDLDANDVRAVADAVNPLVADAFAMYIKTKNFHWHLSGRRFRDYHLLFDEQAEKILDSIDPLAERVRKIGALTLHSIGDIARRTKIEDDDDDYVAPMEMVRRLLADNRKMAEAQRAAIEVCDKRRDTPTGNLLQEVLDETERRIWFLFELTQAEAEDSEAERARP